MFCQEEGALAVGSGPILLSLVESWYEAGLSKLTVRITNGQATDVVELRKFLEQYSHCSDSAAPLNVLNVTEYEDSDWRLLVRPFSFILYVSQNGEIEELRKLQRACIAERKQMLPAIVIRGRGIIGPLLLADGEGRWESAWRRIHASVFPDNRDPLFLDTAAAGLLSNLVVHEWQQAVKGEKEPDCKNHCFILDPVTLTGGWHSILPHPLVSGFDRASRVDDQEFSLELTDGREKEHEKEWFSAFRRLTSTVTGIFHAWGEASLIQLPLAQCLVQPVDPYPEGPAQLLPAIVCSGLTHEEARRESGLRGIEAYAARLISTQFSGLPSKLQDSIEAGAGCTGIEAAWRGLRACLAKQFNKRTEFQKPVVSLAPSAQIEDSRCRYYLKALSNKDDKPLIAPGEPLLGFPVVWVYSNSSWYGSADFSFTHALRQSLQKALNQSEGAAVSDVVWSDHDMLEMMIPASDSIGDRSLLLSALNTLKQHHKRLEVFDMKSESFLGKGPFLVYGVMIGEEEAS
ncbi:hypothetical protein [Paenibacillus fonticola]|uniref:hypothetical protein n=1 Tax=Paenibacillus fonticola TaxID=379896 RepID=UPI0003807FAF|nr:hypothetical protein [Paenibacillus fonticola]